MPNSELVTTSPQQDSQSSEEVVRRWVVYFGEIYGKEITPALVTLWCRLLADIEPALLERACIETAKRCKFFPTPAEIRAQIEQANAGGLQLEAKEAWATYRKHVDENYHPDLGWRRGTPSLSAAVEHAGQEAGGANWVSTCPESELQWCEKRFIDDFVLVHQTGQVEHLLTRGEAKRVLAQLADVTAGALHAQPKALPPDPPPANPTEGQGVMKQVAEAMREVAERREPPPAAPDPEEIERRKRSQLKRFERHLREHPHLSAAKAKTAATVAVREL